MVPSRRHLLLTAASGFAGTAGCVARDSESPSTTDTAPTSAEPTPDQLSYDAAVTEQPSADTPCLVTGRLANTGTGSVRIGTGPTIVPTHRDGRLDTLLLYPDTYVGPNSTPDEPTDGCWRYTDDFLVQDSVEWRDIGPDDAFAETYRLYTVGAESPCLPKGEHRFETSVYFQNEETPVTVGLTVRIDGDSPTVNVENASLSE